MTRGISKLPKDELVDRFIHHAEVQREASRSHKNVPLFNRHVLKLSATAKELGSTGEGRNALEALMLDHRPFVRLRAAQYVLDWEPGVAVSVLGRLLVDDFAAELSPSERLGLRISAKDSLYGHFKIMSFDHNDLIAPLADYGIALPWRDHSAWQ